MLKPQINKFKDVSYQNQKKLDLPEPNSKRITEVGRFDESTMIHDLSFPEVIGGYYE